MTGVFKDAKVYVFDNHLARFEESVLDRFYVKWLLERDLLREDMMPEVYALKLVYLNAISS